MVTAPHAAEIELTEERVDRGTASTKLPLSLPCTVGLLPPPPYLAAANVDFVPVRFTRMPPVLGPPAPRVSIEAWCPPPCHSPLSLYLGMSRPTAPLSPNFPLQALNP